ncbi:MAG: hypothetical protein WBG62_08215, partial [Cyclobacteriaceae bacterium]
MRDYSERPHFILFANCIPVKGASRSLICDVHRHDYDFIPNALYEMLTADRGKPVREVAASYGEENIETVLEYFDYLEEKEYGFYASEEELGLFPQMSLEWDSPSPVTNAILDMDEQSDELAAEAFIRQLDEVMCQALDIRLYYAPSPERLERLLNLLDRHTIESIRLYFRWHADYDQDFYKQIGLNLRVKQVVVSGCNDPEHYTQLVKGTGAAFIFIEKEIDGHDHCGAVDPA